MKNLAIIIAVIILLAAVTAGIYYYKTKFYVPDRNGMTVDMTDTISSCRYSSSAGMNGEATEIEISVNDKDEVWLKYYNLMAHDATEETKEYQIPVQAIEDIRKICSKYGVLGWGDLSLSKYVALDAPTEEIVLVYSDNQRYVINSGYTCPDGGEKIFEEIFDIMKLYINQGGDNLVNNN